MFSDVQGFLFAVSEGFGGEWFVTRFESPNNMKDLFHKIVCKDQVAASVGIVTL